MKQSRTIKKIIHSKPTIEGAGVHLNRVFGFHETQLFDPFLLLDDFRSDDPARYLPGFPWHPHRGIETITYVLAGEVDHGDSLGNRGKLGAGDVEVASERTVRWVPDVQLDRAVFALPEGYTIQGSKEGLEAKK